MKTALVTGANRGIGLEFVKQLANDNWQVIACCRTPQQAAELQDLAVNNPAIQIEPLDVTQQDQIDALRKNLHGQAIDLLINNAGIMGDRGVTIGNIDRDNFLNVINVNCLSVLKISEAFLESVQQSDDKMIVAISSAMGSISDNESGDYYAYRTSKAALNCALRSFAIDVTPVGVKVMLIHPGWVKTELGGDNALVDAQASVTGMLQQIQQHQNDSHAEVLRRFDGGTIAW